jgi:hypothetical protein
VVTQGVADIKQYRDDSEKYYWRHEKQGERCCACKPFSHLSKRSSGLERVGKGKYRYFIGM